MEALQVVEKGQLVKSTPPTYLTMKLKQDFFNMALSSPDGKISVDEIRTFIADNVLKRFQEISLRLDSHIQTRYAFCRREAVSILGRLSYAVAYEDDEVHTERAFYMPEEVRKEVINFLEQISVNDRPYFDQLKTETVDQLRKVKEEDEKNVYGSEAVLDERAESASLLMRVLRLNQYYSEIYNKYNDESFSDTFDLFRSETLMRCILCAGEIEKLSEKRIDAGLVASRLTKICDLSDLAILAIYSTSFEEVASCVIDIRRSFEITSGVLLRSERSRTVLSDLCGN